MKESGTLETLYYDQRYYKCMLQVEEEDSKPSLSQELNLYLVRSTTRNIFVPKNYPKDDPNFTW